MGSRERILRPQPLTAAAFSGYGDVIDTKGPSRPINRGTAHQFAGVAKIDVDRAGGRPRASVYRVVPCPFPLPVRSLERHPLGSQMFVPLHGERFLVVVAPAGAEIDPASVQAFVTDGMQGVNYRPGTWHHPVIALVDPSEFLVIDREGPGENCEELALESAGLVLLHC